MAYGKQRGYYTRGGPSSSQDPNKEWTAKVDKNPYYRTMDILNRVFKKKLRLEAGSLNSTDLKTITVNFGETTPSRIKGFVREGSDDGHSVYLLECDHEWEGRSGHPTDSSKWGMCWTCGAQQSYLGFEHEWQHNIFKSDLVARKLFVDLYADQLLKQAPHVDKHELQGFLNMLINAFDDIRCNSLWEKVYPGSAQAIWERWKTKTYFMKDAVNTDFMAYVFAVAFDVPTNPNGEFESMRPIVEWGVQKVKYRGFANMLIDVRVVLDRCMGAILAKVPPPPPKPLPPPKIQPPPPNQQGGDQDDQDEDEDSDQDQDPSNQGDSQDQDQGQGDIEPPDGDQGQGQDEDGEEGDEEDDSQAAASGGATSPGSGQDVRSQPQQSDGEPDPSVEPPTNIPSAADVPASPLERSDALSKLIKNPRGIDDKEDHPDPDQQAIQASMGSQALKAMMAQTLNADITDLDLIDEMFDDEPDPDMAQAIQQLQDGMADMTKDSLLTSNAKAKITMIDVTPGDVKSSPKIELTDEERFGVNRMRSAFFKAMGRQKAKRSPDGNVVDIPSLIQYINDRQDPDVFENEATHQGFAYSILVDMSGSMNGTFPKVCHAVEMLKQSLKFPFVVGNLWGFRGSESVGGRGSYSGEVWMYRYDRQCTGYTGSARVRGYNGQPTVIPVECGGLTPMNSALNVAVTHLWKHMPSGMAKRMFLLTDGSPVHTKIGGGSLSTATLQRFVGKEIATARQHGIQVYSLIIGSDSISDTDCKTMFGHPRFWKKTEHTGPNSVDKVLTKLVLDNFTKYIKARG